MIILNSKNIEDGNQEGIEELFEHFRRDFIENDTFLKKDGQYFFINIKKNIICPCPYRNKEDKFLKKLPISKFHAQSFLVIQRS